jgi:hypothetical protein
VERAAGLTAGERAVARRLASGEGPLDEAAIEAARRHRVHLLLAATLDSRERTAPWAERLVAELRSTAVRYERRDRTLRHLLEACGSAGIDALVFKGAALAYALYPEPYLRPRTDIDVLIRREALAATEAALAADGWTRDAEPDSELASAQRHYTKHLGTGDPRHRGNRRDRRDRRNDVERLDLHWRLVNPPALAGVASFDALRSRAVPLPLGASVRTLSPGDALFAACLHLVAHHGGDGDEATLLWTFDIHLLSQRLEARDREVFAACATRQPALTACRAALELTASRFDSAAVSGLLNGLPPAHGSAHPAGARTRPIRTLYLDLRALPSWRTRCTLLREHLFPSAAYLRARYPGWPSLLLPVAALHRIVKGAPRWLKQP